MRYFIIPIAVVLYIWWTYRSVKMIRHEDYSDSQSTILWIAFHIVAIVFGATIFLTNQQVIDFITRYW
jgi:Ca2+/Na+ antiporter